MPRPRVNSVVMCTSEFIKRVDLMLSVLSTNKQRSTGELWGGAGYVCYLNCGDGVCIRPGS